MTNHTPENRPSQEDPELSNSPVIRLPDDAELKAKLERKLAEYKSRGSAYKAPEASSDLFKVTVLQELLEKGEVNTYALSQRLEKTIGGVNTELFNNACAVIEDYVTTGGKNARGGTGLK